MDAGSAIVIGVAAVVVVLPATAMIVAYLLRRLESQERLRAIEHGQMLAYDPREIAARTRRSGVVLVAAGCGIMAGVLLAALRIGDVMLAGLGLGVIPLVIGCGLLVDYRLQIRSLRNTNPSKGE